MGKTVDFRGRFDTHPHTLSSYGELTRNSKFFTSLALCAMADQDNIDFAYLVEQIFVCILESYREDVLVDEGRTVVLDSDSAIRHAEATDAALYFRKASAKVFQTTNFPGAINRESFGVSFGANYSSPFKEWSLMSEQRLFLRHDVHVKSRIDGSVMPISIFRSAKMKIAKYQRKQTGPGLETNVFLKMPKESTSSVSVIHRLSMTEPWVLNKINRNILCSRFGPTVKLIPTRGQDCP